MSKDFAIGVATDSEGLSWATLSLIAVLGIGTLVTAALAARSAKRSPSSHSGAAGTLAILLALGFALTLGYALGHTAGQPSSIVVSDEQLARVIPANKFAEQLISQGAREQGALRSRIASLETDLAVARAKSTESSSTTASGLLLLLLGAVVGAVLVTFAGWFRDGTTLGQGARQIDAPLIPTIKAARQLLSGVSTQDNVSKQLLDSVRTLLGDALAK